MKRFFSIALYPILFLIVLMTYNIFFIKTGIPFPLPKDIKTFSYSSQKQAYAYFHGKQIKLPTNDEVSNLAVSHDGKMIAIVGFPTDEFRHRLSVCNLHQQTCSILIQDFDDYIPDFFPSSIDLQFSADDRQILIFTNQFSTASFFLRYNLVNDMVVQTPSIYLHPKFNPVYADVIAGVYSNDGAFHNIVVPGYDISISVLGYPIVTWNPDGKNFAFYDDFMHQLNIVDLEGNIRTIDISAEQTRFLDFAWSPDGKKLVYYDDGSQQLKVVDLEGNIRTINTSVPLSSISFSSFDSTGSKLLFTMDSDNIRYKQVGCVYIDNGSVTFLTISDGFDPDDAMWLNDDTIIVNGYDRLTVSGIDEVTVKAYSLSKPWLNYILRIPNGFSDLVLQ